MEFRKYSSLENHYREKTIDFYRLNGLENVQYVLTEKVHGANFSFWCDGVDVKVASRNQFVDSSFYNCGEIIDKYAPEVMKLFELFQNVRDFNPTPKVLTVYGELYGPGIQKGVDYGARKDFVVFDVMTDGEYFQDDDLRYWIEEYDIGLECVPLLGIAPSLTNALAFPNDFVSILGYRRDINSEDNIAEGYVIKPLEAKYFYIGPDRVILKSKNEKWSEKTKAKKVDRGPNPEDPLLPLIEPYVNENRLNAVTSKMGPLTPKDFGTVIKAMCEDVLEDMVKDGDVPVEWRFMDEFKPLGKAVNKVVVPFLKKELLPKL